MEMDVADVVKKIQKEIVTDEMLKMMTESMVRVGLDPVQIARIGARMLGVLDDGIVESGIAESWPCRDGD